MEGPTTNGAEAEHRRQQQQQQHHHPSAQTQWSVVRPFGWRDKIDQSSKNE
jgi:hypothetical protein